MSPGSASFPHAGFHARAGKSSSMAIYILTANRSWTEIGNETGARKQGASCSLIDQVLGSLHRAMHVIMALC